MNEFQDLVARWFGTTPDAVRMITNGVNKNLRVASDHGDVFARFSPASLHSRDCLKSEAALLACLGELGVPCCDLAKLDGASVIGPARVNDVEYNVLFSQAIPGVPLIANRQDAAAFGRSLAQLHRAPLNRPAAKFSRDIKGEIPSIIKPVFQELIELAGKSSRWSDALCGVCHGDAWLGNAIKRDGMAVLFDFEFAGIGPLVYDIATFIWALRAVGNANEYSVFNGFVEGYRSEHNVTFGEEQLRMNLLHKEINNIKFLCEHIAMSREVEVATARFARETLNFALSGGLSRYRWE
ncbi:Ser/Thr protein kinase RdoA (MazF antagonist) [Rhizobium leguminosarum]|uniref:phosphotransferase enzyme family protein n=1 Tax=Rhizobium TaxID=379 RepID=UPI0016192F81|nr:MULTISPECIES: phosphotransferase [Rhizobium]MBB4299428.1 Ser/Thr protein kinase RdoA (MazF antagonist) [Rhizobium leguminosarum]MBB4436421.1 Ser/Thr protein kinase RdoA (MazF antagonist) [Rhizobium esperanzae]MBB5683735.1 Ser/Thr protein kinase RdoA (MazF antagonist) [Rhizobium leguminosarum]MBB6267713.1 Ser/Thr protein kinase RdoA (MazF antagonist) [Rhizobium leguminosarum]